MATSTALSPDQQSFLLQQGFPSGLARILQSQRQQFAVSFWILDNGSAMTVRDAHLLRGYQQRQDVGGVTRWEELRDCVAYHADFAARFGLPTRYALLNKPAAAYNNNNCSIPQFCSIHQSGNLPLEQQILRQVLETAVPRGPTPLTTQLRILREHLRTIAPQLAARRQWATIVVCTQGFPTNDFGESSPAIVQEFVQTLRSLESLPVCIVLRMCTDDEKTFDFYNGLDAQVQLPIDVLDDFYGEALEVFLRNPWLTYALVLHRYREHGFRVPVLDAIDKRALSVHEIRDLCFFLFDVATLPDPVTDWNNFLNAIGACMARERPHFNPVRKQSMPWINLAHLNAMYGRPSVPPAYPNVQSFSQQQQQSYRSQSMPSQQPSRPQQQQQQYHPASHRATATTASLNKPLTNRNDLIVAVDKTWAKQPPTYMAPKPIEELLGTIDSTFSLVESHSYFETKFHPFAREALQSGGYDVVKRAVRKMRFFLHPDRLPKDLNEQQSLLCRTLWDKISESWELYESNNATRK